MVSMKPTDPRPGSFDAPLEAHPLEAQQSSASQTDAVRSTRDTLLTTAERQKEFGADIVSNVAGAIRKGAGEFEQNAPQAAGYIRYAADQVESMSETLRHRNMGQLVSDLESFARRQPTAFMGATFLAGFMAVRFLKSTSTGAGERGRMNDSGSDWRVQSDGY